MGIGVIGPVPYSKECIAIEGHVYLQRKRVSSDCTIRFDRRKSSTYRNNLSCSFDNAMRTLARALHEIIVVRTSEAFLRCE